MYLPYLEYFRVVARHLNMTRAAEELHVSQPAVSQMIAKLEAELGVSLFARGHGRLSLTEAGNLYLASVERAFAELDRGRRSLAMFQSAQAESVSFSVAIPHLLSEISDSFIAQYPEIRINPYVFSADQALQGLASGKLDLAVVPDCRQAAFEAGAVLDELYSEELMLLVSRSHPLAELGRATLGDMRFDAFALNSQTLDADAFYRCFKDEDFTPEVVLTSNESRVINPLVSSGQAVCLAAVGDLLRDFAEPQFSRDMRPLRIPGSPCARTLMLALPGGRKLTQSAALAQEHIRAFFAQEQLRAAAFIAAGMKTAQKPAR